MMWIQNKGGKHESLHADCVWSVWMCRDIQMDSDIQTDLVTTKYHRLRSDIRWWGQTSVGCWGVTPAVCSLPPCFYVSTAWGLQQLSSQMDGGVYSCGLQDWEAECEQHLSVCAVLRRQILFIVFLWECGKKKHVSTTDNCLISVLSMRLCCHFLVSKEASSGPIC